VGKKPRSAAKQPIAPKGGWPTNKKLPIKLEPASEGKKPVVLDIDHEDIRRRRLVWRFNEVDRFGDWPPSSVSEPQLQDLLSKMASFESMTVGEIFAPGSEHGKTYAVEKLPRAALKRLQELERDDETELARLRCGGAPRLYGFLRDNVFHVLWWDPMHKVYPSKKRNT
jgi:hypothetical protein